MSRFNCSIVLCVLAVAACTSETNVSIPKKRSGAAAQAAAAQAAAAQLENQCWQDPATGAWVLPKEPSDGSLELVEEGPLVEGAAIVDLSQTFRLHSKPLATRTIYLDFTGHTTTGTGWNDAAMGASFYSPPYDVDGIPSSFSDAERTRIQQIWQRVAGDFAAFDVNVTTQETPLDAIMKNSSTDVSYGVRAVITSYGPSSSSAGGVAFVGTFNSSSDTPVFIYNRSVIGVAEAASHEVGHTLWLAHDGKLSTNATYTSGYGTGEISWAPIMGSSYNRSVTTWDDGTYFDSNNTGSTQNYGTGKGDIEVIVSRNGFGLAPDPEGNGTSDATPLQVNTGSVVYFGGIQSRYDKDWFAFKLGTVGGVDLTFDPYWYKSYIATNENWGGDFFTHYARVSDLFSSTSYVENGAGLKIAASLRDAAGNVIASSNSDTALGATLVASNLAPGMYYVVLDGVGFGDPTSSTPTGFTDYASIGNYWMSGTITGSEALPTPTVAPTPTVTPTVSPTPVTAQVIAMNSLSKTEATAAVNTVFLVDVTLSVASSTPVSVSYATAPGTASSTGKNADFVATSGTLTFSPGEVKKQIAVSVVADSKVESNEIFSVVLSGASGASLSGNGTATITIVNDDTSGKTSIQKSPADGVL